MSDYQSELFEKSKKLVPGGVHSPVRSFKGLPVTPRFIKSASGAYITDVDGKDYIDFCMSFGPMILGHKDPDVEADLKAALGRGWSYGTCEPYSLELAEFLLPKLPHADELRFVNSGTEAVMTALRLARGATGRDKILKFDGCYHGHMDALLIKAGSGLAGEAETSSAGVPESVAKDTLILDLGDTEGIKEVFAAHKNEIAAIIVEPLPANNGLLPQSREFLQFLRDITKENGSLLIFDEVISGFRMGFKGMAGMTEIEPDLVTYGKIIGGGLPVGALAGKKEIMEHLAPVGKVYQAGTLSANPLAMVGGLSTLKKLQGDAYEKLNTQAEKIEQIFTKWLSEFDGGKYSNIEFIRVESLFWLHPDTQVHAAKDISPKLSEAFSDFFMELLERGIYLSPNGHEVGFVSLAHDDKVVEDLERRLWQ